MAVPLWNANVKQPGMVISIKCLQNDLGPGSVPLPGSVSNVYLLWAPCTHLTQRLMSWAVSCINGLLLRECLSSLYTNYGSSILMNASCSPVFLFSNYFYFLSLNKLVKMLELLQSCCSVNVLPRNFYVFLSSRPAAIIRDFGKKGLLNFLNLKMYI